jgi:hypothetical protein
MSTLPAMTAMHTHVFNSMPGLKMFRMEHIMWSDFSRAEMLNHCVMKASTTLSSMKTHTGQLLCSLADTQLLQPQAQKNPAPIRHAPRAMAAALLRQCNTCCTGQKYARHHKSEQKH